MADFPPPDNDASEEEYADACAAAVEARLAELVAAAEATGWHRADIQAAILSLTISDLWRLTGTEPTAAILEHTADALRDASDQEQT